MEMLSRGIRDKKASSRKALKTHFAIHNSQSSRLYTAFSTIRSKEYCTEAFLLKILRRLFFPKGTRISLVPSSREELEKNPEHVSILYDGSLE